MVSLLKMSVSLLMIKVGLHELTLVLFKLCVSKLKVSDSLHQPHAIKY